jgi:hypothetical protein
MVRIEAGGWDAPFCPVHPEKRIETTVSTARTNARDPGRTMKLLSQDHPHFSFNILLIDSLGEEIQL